MSVVSTLVWKGEKVLKTMRRAEARGAGFIIFRSVQHARKNHPGWKRRSGKAEKSVRKISLTRDSSGKLVGKWASR